MADTKKGSNRKGRTAAAGITFRLYQPEELASMERGELEALFMEEQEKLVEALGMLKEQDRMMAAMQEQANINKADQYGSRSERSKNLNASDDGSRDEDRGSGQEDGKDGRKEEACPEDSTENDGAPAHAGGGDGKTGKDKKDRQKPRRKKGCIEDVIKDLPVHVREVGLSEEELTALFGTDKVKDGPEKIYRSCRYIPGLWYVEEIHVKTVRDPKDGSIFQPAFAGDFKFAPKSYYSADMISFALDQRFTMAIPYSRLEKWFCRCHFFAKRQPLSQWVIRLDRELFAPLVQRLWHHLLDARKIQIDETPTVINQVRRRDNTPTAMCYMWCFRTSEFLKDVPEVVIFHFDESRSTEVLEECLPGFTGTITSDGHSPYHGFAEKSDGKVTNTGCLNHARTRFARVIRANPALKTLPEKEKENIPVFRIIEMFGRIFKVESETKDLSREDRAAARQKDSAPLFRELSEYIHSFKEGDFDQSGFMYKALEYFKNQEPFLRGFLDDPDVPAHNSACERDIAGYAILRNNIKFIDSIDGGGATASLYSLSATAKAYGVDFYTYMQYILTRLPAVLNSCKSKEYKNMKELDAFMPWSEEFRSFSQEEWERRKMIIESGIVFGGEDNHSTIRRRVAALL